MTGAARDPAEVLASIRRLVARKVESERAREAEDRPHRDALPVLSEAARDAARLVLKPSERLPANGEATRLPDAPDPGPKNAQPLSEPAEPPSQAVSAPDAPDDERHDAPDPGQNEAPALDQEALRALVVELLREEVRTRMGPRINANIRRIVREELAALFDMPASAPDPDHKRSDMP